MVSFHSIRIVRQLPTLTLQFFKVSWATSYDSLGWMYPQSIIVPKVSYVAICLNKIGEIEVMLLSKTLKLSILSKT